MLSTCSAFTCAAADAGIKKKEAQQSEAAAHLIGIEKPVIFMIWQN